MTKHTIGMLPSVAKHGANKIRRLKSLGGIFVDILGFVFGAYRSFFLIFVFVWPFFPKDPATNIENDLAGRAGHKKRFFSAGRAGRGLV